MFKKSILPTALSLSFAAALPAQNSEIMKNINTHAPVKCSKSISIQASPEKVWEVITNINTWPGWQSDISYAHIKGELKPNTTFNWKTGGAKIQSTLHTVNPAANFGWTGKTFGMYAIHNWSLTQNNGFTTVVVDESMEGFLASLLRRSFNKNLEKGMNTWLQLLKTECEKK